MLASTQDPSDLDRRPDRWIWQKTVLDRLSLDVRRGEILGLVGASGGGKSVLLRAIIGLIPRRGGRIAILGANPIMLVALPCTT